MENLKIGFLLHFYQPWWQFPHVLAEIVNKCYRPILSLIKKMPGFCFSANINYSLLELLDRDFSKELGCISFLDHTFLDVIEEFREAVENGKIELLGSTAYHPIMPLIPEKLRLAEMRSDTHLKKGIFGIEKNCNGIFLPEMAWSQSILPNLRACGYKWTVIDDGAFKVQYRSVPFDCIVSLEDFKIFLRSNYWSNRIANGELPIFDMVRRKMEREIPDWTKNQPAYLILAMDAETFGHHHKGLIEKFLRPMLEKWGSEGENILASFEEIDRSFPSWDLIKIADGSWATSQDDFWQDNPFPLWNSKYNEHHQNLWQLVNMVLKYRETPGAGWDCLKIVSSCHWWWISGRPEWKPEFMKFGAQLAMRIIDRFGSTCDKEESKKIFEKLMSLK